MITLKEYAIKYPNQKSYRSFAGNIQPGARLIAEGYLQFDKETACCWAGPWEGGYARFVIIDYTDATILNFPNKSYLDAMEKRRRESYEKEVRKAKFLGNPPRHEWSDEPRGDERGYASKFYPVRLWMMGNDDTSWSKCYKSAPDAIAELDLFSAAEPLNFHEIIEGFGFTFTN